MLQKKQKKEVTWLYFFVNIFAHITENTSSSSSIKKGIV